VSECVCCACYPLNPKHKHPPVSSAPKFHPVHRGPKSNDMYRACRLIQPHVCFRVSCVSVWTCVRRHMWRGGSVSHSHEGT
jgi:hypothetical protein